MSSLKPIQVLPDQIAHKIAAGEVVERPISIVKELVENAIDAGATQLEIDIVKGGIESIRIRDNGHGIPGAQLSIALKRHATSKITDAEDLFNLHTLGFRGEALPSIASVSDFRIESATAATAPVGYVKEVHHGIESDLSEVAMSMGTCVTVQNLFCTTPARLKFLKQPQTEWSHIADFLTAMALGYLNVEWRVRHNGKVFLDCPVASEPTQRILDIFGRETMASMYPMAREVSDLQIEALLGHPNFSSKSNRNLFVYVNGRYVQDRLINHAIAQGYRSLLMKQQYPMVVLKMRIHPSLVDVNVHPAKRELRFSNSNAVHNLVSETIFRHLETAPWNQGQEALTASASPGAEAFGSFLEQAPKSSSASIRDWTSRAPEIFSSLPRPTYESSLPLADKKVELHHFEERPALTAKIATLPFASLKVIGQFLLTYIVCEYDGSLILIDQHAAHERIGFERLKCGMEAGDLSAQSLLHPITFDLSPSDSERLRICLVELEKFGLQVEEFGANTFVLKSYPTILGNCDYLKLIHEVLDQVSSVSSTIGDRVDHVLATMSCHRQVRAKQRLELEEMQHLVRDLEGTPRSYHCPHGRPVMVEIAASEIERWFKRVL